MNDISHKEAVLLYYEELWNEKNKKYIDILFHDEITFRGSLSVHTKGKKEFEKYLIGLTTGIPNLYHGVETIVCEKNLVAVRVHYNGVHTGKLFELGATGKKIQYNGASFFKFKDNKIADIWVLGDLIDLQKQLNVLDMQTIM